MFLSFIHFLESRVVQSCKVEQPFQASLVIKLFDLISLHRLFLSDPCKNSLSIGDKFLMVILQLERLFDPFDKGSHSLPVVVQAHF